MRLWDALDDEAAQFEAVLHIPFKGGWGPSESPEGGHEVIQAGIAGPTVIAIAARAQGPAAAKRLASRHVPQHPNTP